MLLLSLSLVSTIHSLPILATSLSLLTIYHTLLLSSPHYCYLHSTHLHSLQSHNVTTGEASLSPEPFQPLTTASTFSTTKHSHLLFINSLNLIVTSALMVNLSQSNRVIFYNAFVSVTCLVLFSYFCFKVSSSIFG